MKKLIILIGVGALMGCANVSYKQTAALDVVSTVTGINAGGIEANPVLDKLGGGTALGVGLAATGLKAGYYYAARKQPKRECERLMRWGKAINAGAGVNNILQLAKVDSVPSLMIGVAVGAIQYKRANTRECVR